MSIDRLRVSVMYEKEIELPEGVSAEVAGNKVKISGPKGQLEREFKGLRVHGIRLMLTGKKIKVSSESERRKAKALVGTIIAHIRNMIKGVTTGYTYKLKVVYSHFPVTVKVEGNKVLVHNFLGEKVPRVAELVEGVHVEVKGPEIMVSGIDKELVGLMASRLEQATKIKGYSRKVFMDGIYLVSKEGNEGR